MTLYLGMCVLAVVAVIGMLAYFTRKDPIERKVKVAFAGMAILQAVHILLYVTGLLAAISEANVRLGFSLSVGLSLVCLLLGLWAAIPASRCRNAIKYLFVFLAILQVLGTIWIFLLPEAGLPPMIVF